MDLAAVTGCPAGSVASWDILTKDRHNPTKVRGTVAVRELIQEGI